MLVINVPSQKYLMTISGGFFTLTLALLMVCSNIIAACILDVENMMNIFDNP